MLEVRQLRKRIDGRTVLDDISLSIEPGTITGIVGRNGSGKTTLLRTIAGIWFPDGGQVCFQGRNVHTDPETRRHLIFVPDSRELLQHYTPNEFARLFGLIYPHFDRNRFASWLDRFQLPAAQQVRHYSKGMKALFYLALAFATRSDVVLLDEPTDGLDPIYKQQSLRLIVEEVAEQRNSLLISSHRLEELQSICDRVIFLKGGGIDAILDTAAIHERYEKLQVAFRDEGSEQALAKLPGVRVLARSGRVYTILVEEGPADLGERLRAEGAVLVEPLPLQLEDLFVGKLGGAEHGHEGSLA